MGEKRIIEISRQLEHLARVAQTLQGKYAAHMALHQAAVLEEDKEQMSEHRRSLHVLLDRLLDNGEAVQRLSDELASACRP
jgi:hypothetical protein